MWHRRLVPKISKPRTIWTMKSRGDVISVVYAFRGRERSTLIPKTPEFLFTMLSCFYFSTDRGWKPRDSGSELNLVISVSIATKATVNARIENSEDYCEDAVEYRP